jgi:hypothetical protein
MGAILGSGYVALSQYPSASLLVGGAPFTFVMARSDMFAMISALADFQFYSRTDLRIAISSWQVSLDMLESSGWARSGRYQNMNLLLQIALGDTTVTTIGGEVMGRNFGAKELAPFVQTIATLPSQLAPVYANASVNIALLAQYQYPGDAAGLPTTPAIPEQNNVHVCFPASTSVCAHAHADEDNASFVCAGLFTPLDTTL